MFLSLSLSTKKCAAQKETSIEAMDMKSELKPRRSFSGKLLRKSLTFFREVSMARNIINAVMEKQSAASDVMANNSNAGWPSKVGLPVLSSLPPGTVLDVAKATPAMRAATKEHDSEVSLSQLLLSLRSFLCSSEKISVGVFPCSLSRRRKCFGAKLLTYCSRTKSNN